MFKLYQTDVARITNPLLSQYMCLKTLCTWILYRNMCSSRTVRRIVFGVSGYNGWSLKTVLFRSCFEFSATVRRQSISCSLLLFNFLDDLTVQNRLPPYLLNLLKLKGSSQRAYVLTSLFVHIRPKARPH